MKSIRGERVRPVRIEPAGVNISPVAVAVGVMVDNLMQHGGTGECMIEPATNTAQTWRIRGTLARENDTEGLVFEVSVLDVDAGKPV